SMCLAVPGKIIDIDEKNNKATIDYGNGTTRSANISLVQVKCGEYVLVHAGFAIQKVDPKEAQETLQLFNEMMMEGEES
ncbi:MAG: HypC/HybG/HupF family hydrogenase formation chaperone, partial [Thermoplasmatota archaeon]